MAIFCDPPVEGSLYTGRIVCGVSPEGERALGVGFAWGRIK